MQKYLKPVTPAEVSGTTAQLCTQIVPGETPFYVRVVPLEGAQPNECFPVVNAHVNAFGGETIIGWCIWEHPNVFVEAEFHAVWKSPEGEYIDLTPKNETASKILFLPHPGLAYEGHTLNNVRLPISSHPALLEMLQAFDRRYEIMNRGDRAMQHGQITLEGPEAAEYTNNEREIAALGMQIFHLYPTYGPYLPCPCNSGKKAKWCHPDVYREN